MSKSALSFSVTELDDTRKVSEKIESECYDWKKETGKGGIWESVVSEIVEYITKN